FPRADLSLESDNLYLKILLWYRNADRYFIRWIAFVWLIRTNRMIRQTPVSRKNTIRNLHGEVSDPLGCAKWQKTPVLGRFYRTPKISRIIESAVFTVLSPCSLLLHAISSPIDYCIAV
ncbi:MAG: hypothetical protein P8J43_01270, partial [Pirellulales bacterium]|nr:hypothetical protein [Pirellulales bacterium]